MALVFEIMVYITLSACFIKLSSFYSKWQTFKLDLIIIIHPEKKKGEAYSKAFPLRISNFIYLFLQQVLVMPMGVSNVIVVSLALPPTPPSCVYF